MPSNLWQAHELERVPCDQCHSRDERLLFVRPDGMRVVECASCGLAFLNPRPRPDLISRLYEKTYFQKPGGGSSLGYADYCGQENRDALIRMAGANLRSLRRFLSPKGRRFLEIGCATGEFCDALHRHGADVTGIDLSEFAIAEARRRYPGITFIQGGLDVLPGLGRFQAVFAFELIEHLTSPSSFLRSVSALLEPGGLLALSTPNLACGRNVGLENWLGLQISFEHLYFLEINSLTALARQHCLALLTCSADGYGVYAPEGSPPADSRVKAALKSFRLFSPLRALLHSLRLRKSDPRHQHTLRAVFKKL